MKDVVVIHGCPSNVEKAMDPARRTYDKHWMPWLKSQLEQNGIMVQMPLMPDPWEPDYQKFKVEFERLDVDEETILVGHSCGCAFLVRWLGDSKKPIDKLILVAPWKINDSGDKLREVFYNYSIDPTIKERVKQIIYFTADDEARAGKESLDLFHQVLGGEIIELKNHGHYTLEDMKTEQFPELLEEILK